MELNLISQLRTRAIENMVAIALTNYVPPDANGHSVLAALTTVFTHQPLSSAWGI
jgi:hypothetical protein